MKITRDINEAIALLKEGGVLAYPTETSYGLGCDATNHDAVARIMKMKKRPSGLTMPMLVSSVEMAKGCVKIEGEVERLANKHWPGPLTIVFDTDCDKLAPDLIRDGTIAIRVSSNPAAQKLVEGLERPLVATSANLHGVNRITPPSYALAEVVAQFEDEDDMPDMILSSGRIKEAPPSMIIQYVDGEIVVHRKGSFKL